MNRTFASAIELEKANLLEIFNKINKIIDEDGYLNSESEELGDLKSNFYEKINLIFQLKNLGDDYK